MLHHQLESQTVVDVMCSSHLYLASSVTAEQPRSVVVLPASTTEQFEDDLDVYVKSDHDDMEDKTGRSLTVSLLVLM